MQEAVREVFPRSGESAWERQEGRRFMCRFWGFPKILRMCLSASNVGMACHTSEFLARSRMLGSRF